MVASSHAAAVEAYTGLTLYEFTKLLSPYESSYQRHLQSACSTTREWRQRYRLHASSPLRTAADRLCLALTVTYHRPALGELIERFVLTRTYAHAHIDLVLTPLPEALDLAVFLPDSKLDVLFTALADPAVSTYTNRTRNRVGQFVAAPRLPPVPRPTWNT